MKLTKRQLRRIIRESYADEINKAAAQSRAREKAEFGGHMDDDSVTGTYYEQGYKDAESGVDEIRYKYASADPDDPRPILSPENYSEYVTGFNDALEALENPPPVKEARRRITESFNVDDPDNYAPTAAEEAQRINRQVPGVEYDIKQSEYDLFGIKTGYDLALSIYNQTYSDTYKSIYNFRPNHGGFLKISEAKQAIDDLYKEAEARMADEREWERQQREFEEDQKLLQSLMPQTRDEEEYDRMSKTSGMGRRTEGKIKITKNQLRRIIRETIAESEYKALSGPDSEARHHFYSGGHAGYNKYRAALAGRKPDPATGRYYDEGREDAEAGRNKRYKGADSITISQYEDYLEGYNEGLGAG